MGKEKKDKIPKIKKSLGKLLTNESGKLSKKVISGFLITTGLACGLGNVGEVLASEQYKTKTYYKDYGKDNHCKVEFKASHVSGVANGHVSVIPNITHDGTISIHTSHASHNNECYVYCRKGHLNAINGNPY